MTFYAERKLISKYGVYQHLMDYWTEVMQDDCYIISADGWKAETYRILVENKQKKMVDKGWTCDLIPKELVVNRFFAKEQQAIETLEAESETLAGQLSELEEEHGGEEGYFAELDKVNKSNVQARLKELRGDRDAAAEIKVLKDYLDLLERQAKLNQQIKAAKEELDQKLYAKYPTLTVGEIKTLVVDDKWMTTIERDVHTELDRISQQLTQRIKELAERYEQTLSELNDEVAKLEQRVLTHLERMGFEC
jgi:type I restriction enzyme M protein